MAIPAPTRLWFLVWYVCPEWWVLQRNPPKISPNMTSIQVWKWSMLNWLAGFGSEVWWVYLAFQVCNWYLDASSSLKRRDRQSPRETYRSAWNVRGWKRTKEWAKELTLEFFDSMICCWKFDNLAAFFPPDSDSCLMLFEGLRLTKSFKSCFKLEMYHAWTREGLQWET